MYVSMSYVFVLTIRTQYKQQLMKHIQFTAVRSEANRYDFEVDLEPRVSIQFVTTDCASMTLALVCAHGDRSPESAK